MAQTQSRDASELVKGAIASTLLSDFLHTNIPGISAIPTVSRTITSRTPEPYIEIGDVNSEEAYTTKDSESREYEVNLKICLKYAPNRSTHVQRERIVDETIRVLTAEGVFNLSDDGYDVYIVTTGPITRFDTHERGAKYYFAIVPLLVTATFVGLPTANQPAQAALFSYGGWRFTPPTSESRNLELWDAGTITGNNTYPSGNRGYNFASVSYALGMNADGTLVSNLYTIDSDDTTISLDTTINYEFATDSTITANVLDSDTWNRIRSLRYGSSSVTTFTDTDTAQSGLRNLASFTGTNRTFDFGQVNPLGRTITLPGVAGEHPYIIMDAAHSPTAITQDLLGGANIISLFTTSIVGGYRIFVLTDPLVADGDIIVTLS